MSFLLKDQYKILMVSEEAKILLLVADNLEKREFILRSNSFCDLRFLYENLHLESSDFSNVSELEIKTLIVQNKNFRLHSIFLKKEENISLRKTIIKEIILRSKNVFNPWLVFKTFKYKQLLESSDLKPIYYSWLLGLFLISLAFVFNCFFLVGGLLLVNYFWLKAKTLSPYSQTNQIIEFWLDDNIVHYFFKYLFIPVVVLMNSGLFLFVFFKKLFLLLQRPKSPPSGSA